MPSQFKNIEIQDTGFLTLPSGTSSERPASPASGMIRYNTDLGETEWYDSEDSAWKRLSNTFPRTVYDTELVTNGDFSNGVNNWTVDGVSTTTLSNQVNMSGSGDLTQQISLIAGKTYKISAEVKAVSNCIANLKVDTNSTGAGGTVVNNTESPGVLEGTFTASDSSIYIAIQNGQSDSTSFTSWTNVSVREASDSTIVDTEINGRPYRLHYFTETGTDTLTVTAGGEVEYLIVAGGGGGGSMTSNSNRGSGGGGAGGVIAGDSLVVPQSYSFVVGSGGQGNTEGQFDAGTDGENSSALGLTAFGGGRGGNRNGSEEGKDGGSGGGTDVPNRSAVGSGAGAQGNDGGIGNSNNAGAGGGGGAGSVGFDAPSGTNPFQGGAGGIGISSSITGNRQFYAGGGGGGAGESSPLAGNGGLGGGGRGGDVNLSIGQPGSPNTGGGGGGATTQRDGVSNGGGGGSGIVIIRYPRDPGATYSQPDRTISSTLPGNFNIIQDGLILNLDAGNPISYPGSGTTWRDLGQGNDGTISGASFSIDNDGYFEFDGTDDIITGSLSQEPEDVTLEAWVKTPGEDDAGIIGYGSGGSYKEVWLEISNNGNLKVGFYSDDVGSGFPANNAKNQWVYVAGTIKNLLQTAYVNGEIVGTNQGSNTFTGGTSFRIGKGRNTGGQFIKGNIATARIYNRALSDQEIRHNFNVTRGRFGV